LNSLKRIIKRSTLAKVGNNMARYKIIF